MRRLANGTYDFRCPTCGAEGELSMPEDMREPFGCPEGCGTTYVQYRAHTHLHLRCVAWPVLPARRWQPHEETP
jgi:hypothetical protein